MDAPDPRTRHKVALDPPAVLAKSTVLRQVLLSDVFLVLALQAGKAYLLSPNVGVFWVLVRVLACGGVGSLVWLLASGQLRKKRTVEWLVVAASSLLLFLRQAGLFIALFRLPSTRVIIITHYSALWFKSVLSPTSLLQTSAVLSALLISFLSDAGFSHQNFREMLPAYGALAMEAFSSSVFEHTQGVLLPTLNQPMINMLSVIGAFGFSLPMYMLRHVLTDALPTPSVSMKALSLIVFLAFVVLYQAPKASRAISNPSAPPQYFLLSSASTVIASVVLGILLLGQYPSVTDCVVAALLIYGTYPKISESASGSPYAATSRTIRAYLKSILSNPESRKIFYFLMLNMCYMLVQMLYGVWTNSLGLISDAIHMAFDCMAIAVGLIASVMARWPPNERFTYGYGRIETLSGFANGIFLILISFFIVFEAIQRLLDPPEMNTSQLLLVSSLGLAVNLFGMFAMGGHHHGGHSHSHGHDHSHGVSSSSSPLSHHAHHESHSHSHKHNEADPHLHSHSREAIHVHSHSPPLTHTHAHARTHSHLHDHIPIISLDEGAEESIDRLAPPRTKVPLHVHVGLDSHLTDNSPLTPNYKFGHDEHFDTHHASAPNLHDHSHVHEGASEGHSHNMRGVFLHVMADTLGSVGVILSTLLIQFYGWTGFDPIASLFIAVLIAASVIPLVIDTGKVLALDIAEREPVIQQTLSELPSIDGLASYSTPRFWPKDASSVIGSIHIQLSPFPSSYDPSGPSSTRRTTFASVERVVGRVDKLLRSRIAGLEELTIQVEEPILSHHH
ncbi:cation efflux family-domain-containing protein [Sparassis latifolia]